MEIYKCLSSQLPLVYLLSVNAANGVDFLTGVLNYTSLHQVWSHFPLLSKIYPLNQFLTCTRYFKSRGIAFYKNHNPQATTDSLKTNPPHLQLVTWWDHLIWVYILKFMETFILYQACTFDSSCISKHSTTQSFRPYITEYFPCVMT